jgi:hypothetical protein
MTDRGPTAPALGGYFELELPASVDGFLQDALKFQSARAAFRALLLAGRPARVWMPKYICDAMLAPLNQAGIEIAFYDLDRNLGVAESVVLGAKDWLLYVNYFGVCSAQEERLLHRFDPARLIFDRAQAIFAPPRKSLAAIYSPRKFFGVPDGGLLDTVLQVSKPEERDADSVERCMPLLKRLDVTPEAGYADFRRAEEMLLDTTPRRMSGLSERLFASIDHDMVRQRRNANFEFLHRRLGHLNRLEIDPSGVDGPLCYPLLVDIPLLHERFWRERVFVASYWPDAKARAGEGSIEHRMACNCLPLPCDQRCGERDLARVADLAESLCRR